MPITDSVADALTMLRNASSVKKEYVDIPVSKIIKGIVGILKERGYIDNFKLMEYKNQGRLRVYLKYDKDNAAAISNIKKISRPGLRAYVSSHKVPVVLRGKGLAIISTSGGIMTDSDCRKAKIGGEVICYVW